MVDPIHPQGPFVQPLEADQGSVWTLPLQICNPDASGAPDTANPINLTGATFKCLVKENGGKNAKLIATVTVTAIDLTHGLITLSLTAAQTKLIPGGDYYYDLAVKIGSADPQYYIAGPFKVYARASQF